MRVLYLPSWYPSSKNLNAGLFIEHLAKDLASEEIQIEVLCFHQHYSHLSKNSYQKIEKQAQLVEHHFDGWTPPKFNASSQKIWLKSSLKRMNEKINPQEYDIIHAHGYLALFLAQEIASKHHIPLVTSLHHSDVMMDMIPEWRKAIFSKALQKSGNIIVPSKAMAASLQKYGYKNQALVIPNYIHESEIPAKKQLKKSPEKFISIGSLEPLKNYEACFKLIEKTNKYLDVYGFGPEERKWRKFLYEKKLDNRIRLMGKTNHSELMKTLCQYDAHISTSLFETFGIGMLESLAAGLPVMCLNKYGSADFIHEKNGLFISDHEDPMAEFEERYSEYNSQEIREEIVLKFSKKNIIPKYIKLYRSLCVE